MKTPRYNFNVQSTISSANTSINSTKLPAIFKKIDLSRFEGGRLLDYGCGRYTDHIAKYVRSFGIQYLPYDPFWKTKVENERAMSLYPTILVCSNVLNVIKDDSIVHYIHSYLTGFKAPYFITVYEGKGDGVGKQTKEDCYQRNSKLSDYILHDEVIKKKVLTSPKYLEYIK